MVECGSIFGALQLVKRSDAILIMADPVARDYLGFGVITALPLALDESMAPFGILKRRGERLNEASREFAARVRAIAGSATPRGDAA